MGFIKKIKKEDLWGLLYVFAGLIFASTWINFLISGKSINDWQNYFYLFGINNSVTITGIVNCIIFAIIFILMIFSYIKFLKNKKISFKKCLLWISIISIVFALGYPLFSSDVFSYIASGWIKAKYNMNPYITSAGDIVNLYGQSEMTNRVYYMWLNEPSIYGPIWVIICSLFSGLSFGNVVAAVYIFKIANVIIHICNCILIYKIFKKKFWMLVYGLNPLVLIEGLENVHNDIWVLFFIFLAIYFLIRKPNLFFSILFLTIATSVKIFPVVLMPYFVIYYFREKSIKQRIYFSILYAMEFFIIYGFLCVFIGGDFFALNTILLQQSKYGGSIITVIGVLCSHSEIVIFILKNALLGLLGIVYLLGVIKLFFEKDSAKISLRVIAKKYELFIFVFVFFIMTSFHAWYILWFFNLLPLLKSRNIKRMLVLINIILLEYLFCVFMCNDNITSCLFSYCISCYYIFMVVCIDAYKKMHSLTKSVT